MSESPQQSAASEGRLADGSVPATAQGLLARLDELGIAAESFEHPAVYTVEESKALCGELEGAHIKNLFLRNKKGAMWLVTCQEDREIDLKALGERIGAGRLSFGSADRLMKYLGVLPGTGGLTRVVDKRKVRRDRADIFCTVAEGIKGKRAVEWGLVDGVFPSSVFRDKVNERLVSIAGDGHRTAPPTSPTRWSSAAGCYLDGPCYS